MDLIEVLWKQDVDLGYNPPLPQNNPTSTQKEAKVEDDIERLETLLELKDDKVRKITVLRSFSIAICQYVVNSSFRNLIEMNRIHGMVYLTQSILKQVSLNILIKNIF